jgi:hypothetical protein
MLEEKYRKQILKLNHRLLFMAGVIAVLFFVIIFESIMLGQKFMNIYKYEKQLIRSTLEKYKCVRTDKDLEDKIQEKLTRERLKTIEEMGKKNY